MENDSCFVSASPRLDSLPALFLELKWSLVRLIRFLLPESRSELSVLWALAAGEEARLSGLLRGRKDSSSGEIVLGTLECSP